MNFSEIKKNLKKHITVYQGIYRDKRTSRFAKFFLWLAIGYFFLPFDIIPDFIPVLGQLDDILIIPLFVYIALRFIPGSLYQEYYNKVFSDDIIYGISERADGNMRIDGDFEKIGLENRKKFFDKLGIGNLNSVLLRQRHSCNVLTIDKNFEQKVYEDFDGLVTADKKLILCITVGDCLPIYFYDSKKEVIGIAHAGWKGVLGNISKNMIEKMSLEFGSKPEDIKVEIGPHIKNCHFLVKEDVSSKFMNYKKYFKKSKDGIFIDLSKIVKEQLTDIGVHIENIDTDTECTHCDNKFFSYRRDKPEYVETMMAYIAIK